MFDLRDVIIFLAGAQFFHTLSHILIGYFFEFPLKTKIIKINFTYQLNLWAVIINAIITVALLWWAMHLPH